MNDVYINNNCLSGFSILKLCVLSRRDNHIYKYMKFERKSGFLRLNGIHMTEGNDNELVEIQSNWIKIIKNEEILSSYVELNKSISEIKKKSLRYKKSQKKFLTKP